MNGLIVNLMDKDRDGRRESGYDVSEMAFLGFTKWLEEEGGHTHAD